MSFVVHKVDRRSGSTYAYLQESYWDKSKGAPRARRTYLGRVDPETGEIIPKRTRAGEAEAKADAAEVAEANGGAVADADAAVATAGDAAEVERLRARVAELEAALRRLSADALAAAGGE